MKKQLLPFLLLLIFSCTSQPIPVEKVAQKWVEAYYNSEFETAKTLSTALTKTMIDSIKLQLVDEEDLLPFQIKNMRCEIKGDSAACTYMFKDDQEEFEEVIHLIAEKGHWLVDEPLSDDAALQKEMEQYFEEYEQLLNEELENLREDE